MKYLALPLLMLLTGCGTLATADRMFSDNLLDAAPKGDFDVLYPEWGYAPKIASTGVQGPMGQQRVSSYDSLQSFLLKNGVDYEVLPGNHIMVKLKDTVKFETGSSTVSSGSGDWLTMMGSYLASEPGIDIVIDGHTDSSGAPTFNDGLSERRAKAVKNTLVKSNVAMDSIFTRGYGEYVPACTNKTNAGKACNRRVEVLFIVSNN
ncbi:OmpA family protein [Vibrio sp. V23_P3S9T160]|uniref:OmpA family protein n=1 Tax=Vibrio sp. V23_P3S9T160 TaxID=1938675 RepID=UPI0013733BC8|nr:OmpA family protein [Vibrio sp. V23_P3S9T160]NAW98270.1 OmpA family protein [Vibrio sp. V23_P3S9T160]